MSEWKPRQILEELFEECRRKRSLKTIRPIIAEKLNAKGDELKKFTHHFNGYTWQGFIYQKRNSLMGSIFSFWNNKFIIIRGYPKIKYVEETQVIDREAVVEAKYDGTNLGMWLMPNGMIMGKTRLVERWDVQGYQGRNWYELWRKCGLEQNIMRLLKEDYQVFGELYGRENKGEFVSYSIPIAFKVFDIVDRRTFSFVSRREKERLCSKYDIPIVEVLWEGILTFKEAERLEFEAKQYVHEDGYEGFVAKTFSESDMDEYFAKIKCEEIKEKCIPDTMLVFDNDFVPRKPSSISIGTQLLGNNKVIKTFSRQANSLLEMQIKCLLPMELTEEHPVLIYRTNKARKKGIIQWIKAKDIIPERDYVLVQKIEERPQTIFIPKVAKDRNWKDYSSELDENWMRFLGWYLAEGFISEHKGVHSSYRILFSLGAKEEETARFLVSFLQKLGLRPKYYFTKQNTIVVYVYCKSLALWLKSQFNSGAKEKKIPKFVLEAPKELLEEFLKAYAKGDGCRVKNKTIIGTASEKVAYQMILLLTKLGKVFSIHKAPKNQFIINYYESPKQRTSIDLGDKVAFRVKRIMKKRFNGQVYNFETENNTYHSIIIVHNCWETSHTTIPSSIIAKAIKKALDELGKFRDKDEFENFIVEELKEEASEELISRSKDKIRKMIYDTLTPIHGEEEIVSYLKELEKTMDITDKGKVMRNLANKFIGYNPSQLYAIYSSYLKGKRNGK